MKEKVHSIVFGLCCLLRLIIGSNTECSSDILDKEKISKTIHANLEELIAVKNELQTCVDADIRFGPQEGETLKNEINNMKRELSELANIIHLIETDLSIVAPAFEWAQSADAIYIGVKFAHKLDTPACIDVVDEKVTILPDSVALEAQCRGKRKQFTLNLDLHEQIDESESGWAYSSVGRGVLTLQKKQKQTRWEKLLKSDETPRNMHIWWELTEKYHHELRELDTPKKEKQENKIPVSDAVHDEEKDEEEVVKKPTEVVDPEKAKAKREAKKVAKQERAAVKKNKKSAMKSLDEELVQLKKDLEEEFEKKKQMAIEEYEKEMTSIQSTLSASLAKIESGDSEGVNIFSKMSSFFGGKEEKKNEL